MTNFLAFGLGLATPLLAFAVLAESFSERIIGLFTRRPRPVNRVTGAVVLLVSLYYLFVVFDVFDLPF